MYHAIICVGVPYSGKSTVAHALEKNGYALISSDALLDLWATEENLSYNDAFAIYASHAQSQAMAEMRSAAKAGKNIVVDMTNMGKKSRAKKIKAIQDASGGQYRIDAYVFTIDDVLLAERRRMRPYRVISQKIVDDMRSRYERPASEEGFTDIIDFRQTDNDLNELARKVAIPQAE